MAAHRPRGPKDARKEVIDGRAGGLDLTAVGGRRAHENTVAGGGCLRVTAVREGGRAVHQLVHAHLVVHGYHLGGREEVVIWCCFVLSNYFFFFFFSFPFVPILLFLGSILFRSFSFFHFGFLFFYSIFLSQSSLWTGQYDFTVR